MKALKIKTVVDIRN